jgi:hypothetical protein
MTNIQNGFYRNYGKILALLIQQRNNEGNEVLKEERKCNMPTAQDT